MHLEYWVRFGPLTTRKILSCQGGCAESSVSNKPSAEPVGPLISDVQPLAPQQRVWGTRICNEMLLYSTVCVCGRTCQTPVSIQGPYLSSDQIS